MTNISNSYQHQVHLLKEAREGIAVLSTQKEANVWYCHEMRSLRDALSLERAKSRRSLEHSRYGSKQVNTYV